MAIRNNLLFYYNEDIRTIGGHNTVQAAVGVLSKFDHLVIKPHTTHLTSLKKVLTAIKVIKPGFKVYGYTNFGGSADMAAWQALVDSWVSDLAGLLDGVFLDNFGSEFGLATRTNQNTAVTYCHTNSLAAMVSAVNPIDVLGQVTSQAEPLIGRSSTIRDTVLVDGYYFTNEDAATPTVEIKESIAGRLEFAKQARRKPPVPPATSFTEHNVNLAVNLGGGNASGLLESAYDAATTLAAGYGVNLFSVTPFDRGATSFKYFNRFRPNTFAD